MNILERIKQRIAENSISYQANDNIYSVIEDGELVLLEDEILKAAQHLLNCLLIDTESDHNTKDTARRMARMFIDEIFAGRYQPPPKLTDFPNVKNLDELYTLGPISVRSTCAHHFAPITGRCWLGVIPSDRIIGISKFVRLARWILERPQIQEEAVVQLADAIEEAINPAGLALVIKAGHACMTWRGVREHATEMSTSVMRGAFRDKPEARAEFMTLIQGQGYGRTI